jgi:hypothetical protein
MGGTFGGYSVRPAVPTGRRATPITLPGRETFQLLRLLFQAGTGKSMVTSAIVNRLNKNGTRIVRCGAPTGVAGKRFSHIISSINLIAANNF